MRIFILSWNEDQWPDLLNPPPPPYPQIHGDDNYLGNKKGTLYSILSSWKQIIYAYLGCTPLYTTLSCFQIMK